MELDWGTIGGFKRRALEEMAAIPYGETRTYTELAAAAGNPAAVRAAGSACATNPWPVIVPCHRVLRTDGTLGGYLGGLEMKRGLLELEAAGAPATRNGAPAVRPFSRPLVGVRQPVAARLQALEGSGGR